MHDEDEATEQAGRPGPTGATFVLAAVLLCVPLGGCMDASPVQPEADAGRAEAKGSLVTLEDPVRLECLDPDGRIFYEDMRQVLEVFDDLSRRFYMERAGGELLSGRQADHLTCRFVSLGTSAGRAGP